MFIDHYPEQALTQIVDMLGNQTDIMLTWRHCNAILIY